MAWEIMMAALIVYGMLMVIAGGSEDEPSLEQIQERMLAEKKRHLRVKIRQGSQPAEKTPLS
jgi:hypothetical protein